MWLETAADMCSRKAAAAPESAAAPSDQTRRTHPQAMPIFNDIFAWQFWICSTQCNAKYIINDLNWTIWYVFSVSTFTCCNETQWVAKIKCLLLTRQQHDWYTALNISIFYKKGGKDRSGLRAESNGWTRKENYFQVKNFYDRKPSLRIAGFVTSKYESSILTLKITWLQHTFDSGQPKTNLLSQLFWSKGKAISKYKDRLYFLVNFKIDFAQLYRAQKKIIFLAQVPKPLLLTIMPKSRLSFILLLELLLFKLIVWLSSRWNWTPHPSSCASREESSVREDF